MLCEVSRLLTEDHSVARDWHADRITGIRVTDLLSLIEAISLHDTLYTLPARLDSEAQNLQLRHELTSRGIVKVLDTSEIHASLAKSILLSFSKVNNAVSMTEELHDELAAFLMIGTRSSHSQLDNSFYDDLGQRSPASEADSLEECEKLLIGWYWSRTGAYQHCTSIMRDMYYVLAAETFGIPYWPQLTRRKFTSQFPNYLNENQLLQLYSQLAKEFKATVTDIFDDHKEELTFVPPFASLVLARSSKPQDIVDRILEVRDEYAGLRQKLSDLEEERSHATSIAERLEVRKRQKYFLNELASAFDRPSSINLEGVIRYIPQLMKPAMKPTDPTSYSAELLLLPARQLILWWKRRPIAKFFVLADKLKQTEEYPTLIQRLFGDVSIEAY